MGFTKFTARSVCARAGAAYKRQGRKTSKAARFAANAKMARRSTVQARHLAISKHHTLLTHWVTGTAALHYALRLTGKRQGRNMPRAVRRAMFGC